jgi:hypothetical protein
MPRALRLLPAAWLVLLLLLPAAAWVLGDRQSNLENRPPRPVPHVDVGALGDAATFTALDGAIVDRLPLRQLAVEARGRIAVDLFRDSPNADVEIGRDGWLYYHPETLACTDEGRPAADPADAAEIVARTLVASGRRTGVVVAGSKIVTHPQELRGFDADDLACVRRTEDRVHRRLEAVPGGLDVQGRLDALEKRGTPTFLKSDTHWNTAGREVYLRALLDRVRPGLADDVGLRPGRVIDREGDLGRFLGFRRTDRDRVVEATKAPARPFADGEVAIVGDSQTDFSLHAPIGTPSVSALALPGHRACSWPTLDAGGCDTALRDADTVITEIVGRNLRDLVNVCWRPVAIAGERLRGRAGAWERPDGAPRDGRRLTLDASGQAVVRVRPPGGDVRAVPRLLRLPIRTLPAAAAGQPPSAVTQTQEPQNGPPTPCGTPAQGNAGAALFLPVPAGRPASELVVRLTGPPGAVLGAPQEIVLDGRALVRR